MLDGINPQAAAFTASQSYEQSQRTIHATPNSEYEEAVTTTRQVRTVPGQDEVGADGRKRDSFELSQEAEEIRQLQARDREVRAHEAAHAAAGGAYAGGPTYGFERGPDGQTYAVSGEVGIDVSPIAGDPQATLKKAQQVRAAALAPAEPSAQDMRVAQRAQAMAAEARIDISKQMSEDLKKVGSQAAEATDGGTVGDNSASGKESDQPETHTSTGNISPGFARLSVHA